MMRDRRGRLRRPGQGRGLRPIEPKLPERWLSRALRVAMAEGDWARFDALVGRATAAGEPTEARARGRALRDLMERAERAPAEPGPLAWMDWERRKALGLLRAN